MTDTSRSSSTYPTVRFGFFGTLGGNTSITVIGQNAHQPALTVVEGLDLVDSSLTVNNQAVALLFSPGLESAEVPFFQSFVYDTSQAYFPWRGSLPVFPSEELIITAFAGNWSYSIWGHIEPAFGISP